MKLASFKIQKVVTFKPIKIKSQSNNSNSLIIKIRRKDHHDSVTSTAKKIIAIDNKPLKKFTNPKIFISQSVASGTLTKKVDLKNSKLIMSFLPTKFM
jgi:hypothetical protein